MRTVFATSVGVAAAVNPIGSVLKMLADLKAEVVQVGEEEQSQYDKFTLLCRDRSKELQFSLSTVSDNTEEAQATCEKAKSDIGTADAAIGDLSESISSAEQELKEASGLRKEELATFQKTESELKDTVSALERAHGILSRKSFAQLPEGTLDGVLGSLNRILSASSINMEDSKQKLTALVQAQSEAEEDSMGAPAAAAYEKKSGGIVEVLAEMLDKAETQLSDARKGEMESKHNYELLRQSLTDKMAAATRELDTNKNEKSKAEESFASAEGDLVTLKKDKKEDTAALTKLRQDCQNRAAEYEQEVAERASEVGALNEATKIIASTTGGAASREYAMAQSFLQMKAREISPDTVVASIRHVGLLALASRVKTTLAMGGAFDKVKSMITDMITKLENEAEKEASEKAFCDEEMAKATKSHERKTTRVEDLQVRTDKTQSLIAKLKEQVAASQTEVKQLMSDQLKMDKMRSEQKSLFEVAAKEYNQGLDGLQKALKVLRDYYAAKEEPESFIQTAKSTDAATGIISMLEVAESDFSQSLAEIKASEDEQVTNYEDESKNNQVRIATLNTEVKAKSANIKSAENSLAETADDLDNAQSTLATVEDALTKLTDQCVAKPEPYEERKKRRENEIAGLKQAIDILENESSTSFLSIRPHY